jgi:quercetin dioxygenase-like cupin family protein
VTIGSLRRERIAVQLQLKTPTFKNPPTLFTGDVWVDAIASPQEEGQRMTVARVRFAPGARSNWHSHVMGQTLHVTEGVGLVQARGGKVIEIRPGDVVYTPPGEEHWHGATPENLMREPRSPPGSRARPSSARSPCSPPR